MKPLVCFHDSCTDGFGAAFAAWLKFGDEAEYVPTQYGSKQDFLKLEIASRDVYILDFSFPRDVMEYTFAHAKRVVWLDHHKSAFEMWCGKYEKGMRVHENVGTPDVHELILDDNKSGALLAWEWFHGNKNIPMLIQHIDDRDRWQFKLEGSKELHAQLASAKPWSFEQWKSVFFGGAIDHNNVIALLKSQGAAILRAQDAAVISMAKQARKCEFRIYPTGYDAWQEAENEPVKFPGLAVNSPIYQSEIGHELANRSSTYGLVWYTNDGKTAKCSLRSNGDYDVSAIARVFGGGGHLNAAGFEVSVEMLLGWLTC